MQSERVRVEIDDLIEHITDISPVLHDSLHQKITEQLPLAGRIYHSAPPGKSMSNIAVSYHYFHISLVGTYLYLRKTVFHRKMHMKTF